VTLPLCSKIETIVRAFSAVSSAFAMSQNKSTAVFGVAGKLAWLRMCRITRSQASLSATCEYVFPVAGSTLSRYFPPVGAGGFFLPFNG